ncbi:hypothetical protein GCM10023144_25670 [Pigmentiphaga soli]|uniref:Phasin domain-containing protein n=2 Tax=Pigmentiphaga soli TaxID=1007095 RepID=A0ABP8H3M3_9BURK
MALAGTQLSERDRKEFNLMGMEKLGAFTAAYNAMAWASLASSQTLAMQMWLAWCTPWMGNRGANRLAQQMQQAAVSILSKGLAPAHAKATANARRLAATPLVAAPRRRTRA